MTPTSHDSVESAQRTKSMSFCTAVRIRTTGPKSITLRENTAEQIRLAIQNLPAQDRELILLRDFEQLSYKQIAWILNLQQSTVALRLRRSRMMLDQVLTYQTRAEVPNIAREFRRNLLSSIF